jgi:hypothetical protein
MCGAYAHNAVFWAVDSVGAAFTAGGWVSVVSGAVCMLDGALDAVSEAVAAGNIGIGGCDVATSMGALGYVNRVWGVSWGRRGGVEGAVGRHCSWWGCLGAFVKYMTHSEERVHTTSRNGVFWAVYSICMSFTAW